MSERPREIYRLQSPQQSQRGHQRYRPTRRGYLGAYSRSTGHCRGERWLTGDLPVTNCTILYKVYSYTPTHHTRLRITFPLSSSLLSPPLQLYKCASMVSKPCGCIFRTSSLASCAERGPAGCRSSLPGLSGLFGYHAVASCSSFVRYHLLLGCCAVQRSEDKSLPSTYAVIMRRRRPHSLSRQRPDTRA